MRSKKTLFIILIIGLVIFIVSWAIIGRPWGQAVLFSIGFFLVVAILSSRGLLIPEKLFDRGPSNRPQEATNKEDFLKGMDSDLVGFSAQPKATTEDIHWMTEYTRVMKEVGELVHEVHKSVKSKDKVKQSRAFRRVAKELPRLISQFKDIPELAIPRRQKTMKRQAQGMDLYLVACSNFAEALERGDGNLAGRAALQMNKALNRLDIV